jgi:hypothetical protein
MNAKQTVEWLNERDPINQWSLDDDAFCRHCDGVFKIQDIVRDRDGDATCPVCHAASPMDFRSAPWWREDLMYEDGAGCHWIHEPIKGIAGRPRSLPPGD